jgi:hypothetical protein
LQQDLFDSQVIIPIIIALLSFFAAIMSAIAAYQANSIAKSLRSSDVLKLFFDIVKELPMDGKTALTVDQKQFMCNYFDYVCFSIQKKRLNKDEIEMVEEMMLVSVFVNYMTAAREKGNKSTYKFYFEWYSNKKDKSKG